MSRRLMWLALFALLLTPLLGPIGTTQQVRAQDVATDSSEPTVEVAPADATTPDAVPTDEATGTAEATASDTPEATDVPVATDVPTEVATESPTDDATDVATPVATDVPTETVTAMPSATANASPTPKGKVQSAAIGSTADLSISLNCTSTKESIKVSYSGLDMVTITQISTLVDQTAAEPFTVNAVLRPSRPTAFFFAGSGASGATSGTVLTTHFIFTNSAYDADGVSIVTDAGTVEQHCAPKPLPVDPSVSNPGKLSDLSVTLDCRSFAESIRVTNNGSGYVRVKSLATDFDALPSEPFHVDVLLRPGKTSLFQAGNGAKYGTILTHNYIFTNSVWDQDGIRISTSVGKLTKSCDPKPLPPERWVEVNLSMQYLWVWEGDTVVNETYVSTGVAGLETPTGTFHTLVKYLTDDMEGVINGQYYFVPQVPWVQYFTDEGHALHGTYWHNNFGHPMSHGCVNLPMDFAEWLYYWLPLRARVVIHY
jgi:hypothetical protein